MECDYVTPSYFRELEQEFQSQLMADGTSDERLDALAQGRVAAQGGDDSDDDSEMEPSPAPSSRPSISRETSPAAKPAALGGAPPPVPQRADLNTGWLEKRTGDSSSLSALPVDSWKWQRRWFVLAMETGFLYYFKSPEQMATASPKVRTVFVRGGMAGGRVAACELGVPGGARQGND